MNDTKEVRCFSTEFEFRKDEESRTPGFIEGYAAVFNSETEIGGFMREMIAPGAFSDVLSNDVRALFNHDTNQLLGRVSSKTLILTQDERGLFYRVELPNTELGRSIAELTERGDIKESSFGFYVDEETYSDLDQDMPLRTITKIGRLFDVSPVTFAAYSDTTVAKRSLELHKKTEFDNSNVLKLRCDLLRLKNF